MNHHFTETEPTPSYRAACGNHRDNAVIASRAGVKTLVLTHLLGQIDQPGIREQIVHEIQQIFNGTVIWGRSYAAHAHRGRHRQDRRIGGIKVVHSRGGSHRASHRVCYRYLAADQLGALSLAMTFLVGAVFKHESAKEMFSGFPVDLFVLLVGVTYLLGVAANNGTVERVVEGAARSMKNRRALLPWMVFVVAAMAAMAGALGSSGVAMLTPFSLRIAERSDGVNGHSRRGVRKPLAFECIERD